MEFKIIKVTNNFITAQAENLGAKLKADFSIERFKKNGVLHCENLKFYNENQKGFYGDVGTILNKLSDWLMRNHMQNYTQ